MFGDNLEKILRENSIGHSALEARRDESYTPTIDGLKNLSEGQLEIIASNAIYDLNHVQTPELAYIRRTIRLLSALLLKHHDVAAFSLAEIVFLFLDQTRQLDDAHQKNTATKLQELIIQDIFPAKIRGALSDSERLFIANELLSISDLKVTKVALATSTGKLTVHGNNTSAFSFAFNGGKEGAGVIGVSFAPSIEKLDKLVNILGSVKRGEFNLIDHADALEVATFVEELVKSGVLSDLITVAELRALSREFSEQSDNLDKYIVWARNFEHAPITTSIEAALKSIRKL